MTTDKWFSQRQRLTIDDVWKYNIFQFHPLAIDLRFWFSCTCNTSHVADLSLRNHLEKGGKSDCDSANNLCLMNFYTEPR